MSGIDDVGDDQLDVALALEDRQRTISIERLRTRYPSSNTKSDVRASTSRSSSTTKIVIMKLPATRFAISRSV
jgi:hypothetical protein